MSEREREMRDKKQYRDRVDVRFDDRFRFNRHREGAEKMDARTA